MPHRPLTTLRRTCGAAQIALGLLAGGICLWLLRGHLDTATLGLLNQRITDLDLLRTCGAAGLCLLSFWAVGRYDVVAHRHLQTAICAMRARVSGTVAVALSQTLGVGIFTGALARWRLLPDLGVFAALRLSAFVSLSFLGAWACVTALTCVALPSPDWARQLGWLVLLLLPICLFLVFWFPSFRVGRRSARMPSLTACGAILFWTAVDTSAAAGALWLLLPTPDLAFAALLPVYLMALGTALLTGTPGGVGPFELTLLTLLPAVPSADLLAGVVLFRLLHYAVPTVLAMIALLRPLSKTRPPAPQTWPSIHNAPRAEVGVMRQNGATLLPFAQGACVAWPTGQTFTALFDPIAGRGTDMLAAVQAAATARNLIPWLYKCTGQHAVAARRRGWHVTHIADEAVLSPARFDLRAPACRRLRRKLRKASHAQVSTTALSPGQLPFEDLAAIDAAWVARNGGARAGTMGRFFPHYLSRQKVFVAYQRGRPAAFVSFHHTGRQWCLDLMRSAGDAPNGTMHALICTAIAEAATEGIAELSLAATPACPDPKSACMRALATWISARSGGPGLRQFKSSFAPRWQPLYAAAPSAPQLALALADIARAIHRSPVPSCHETHEQDEHYALAPRRAS